MKNRKKGFTVVELVIVIAVIGILSAILIPTFSGLIAKANAEKAQLELRNAYVAYTADENIPAEEVKAEGDVYVVHVVNDVTTAYAINAKGEWTTKDGDTEINEETAVVEAKKLGGPYNTNYFVYEK